MLMKKAIRKIFLTTMSLFIILCIYMIPFVQTKEKVLETNLEIEYVTGLGNHSIYLLNNDNLLVKAKILLDSDKIEENIKTLIQNMTVSNSTKFPESLTGVIPKNTKLLNIYINDSIVTLNFSKEFLNIEEEKENALLEALVFSITDLKEIKGLKIEVESKKLDKYPSGKGILPNILTREIGINKKYQLTQTKDINKVVIYYLEKIDQSLYYVPVTKYINDARDKIDIIVEELTTSYIYEPNLMSLVNENTKLINYDKDDDLFILNFNDALFDENGEIKEEVLYTISYSIFDNYDVKVASFRVNEKEIANIKKSNLP